MELNARDIYAACWRIVQLTAHRYGSCPVGQLLVVMTILLLDYLGKNPTLVEVAAICGLPKSSVSRYVASEMSAGFLEEIIDPRDRRRRILLPTDKARAERGWHEAEIQGVVRRYRHARLDPELLDDPVALFATMEKSG